jgi:DNA polymerase III alpha subunit
MAFLEIYDDNGKVDSVLFPETYARFKKDLSYGVVYLGEGNVEERNEKKQFVIKYIKTVD